MENEIDLSDTIDQNIENINGKKAHVWVTLSHLDHKIKVKALIDTGNTIKEETAIWCFKTNPNGNIRHKRQI